MASAKIFNIFFFPCEPRVWACEHDSVAGINKVFMQCHRSSRIFSFYNFNTNLDKCQVEHRYVKLYQRNESKSQSYKALTSPKCTNVECWCKMSPQNIHRCSLDQTWETIIAYTCRASDSSSIICLVCTKAGHQSNRQLIMLMCLDNMDRDAYEKTKPDREFVSSSLNMDETLCALWQPNNSDISLSVPIVTLCDITVTWHPYTMRARVLRQWIYN